MVGIGSGERVHAFAVVFDHLPHRAFHRQAPQHFQDHVLGRNPRLEGAREVDTHDLGGAQEKRPPAHGHRHIQAAGPDGEHAGPAAGRGVRVGPQQRLARRAEALEVHLVADAIARLGKVDPVLGRHRPQVRVVVGVFETGLEHVVVNIRHRDFRGHSRKAHRFELQVRQRPGGVLRQRLVNADADLRTGLGAPLDYVVAQDLLCKA